MRRRAVAALLGAALFAMPVSAHHEAIFGPQSSLVLSAPAYLSVQAFTRRVGTKDNHAQETTVLASVGFSPFEHVPLSFTGIFPASHIETARSVEHEEEEQAALRGLGPAPASFHTTGESSKKIAFEDIILGARYRFDFNDRIESTGREGNFALVMGAAEFPTGAVDHKAFDGPMDYMAAVLGSLEWSEYSAIAYYFHRLNGEDGDGFKPGDFSFWGAGLAYTPIDDAGTRDLLSLQLGLSYELYAEDQQDGRTIEGTGGTVLVLHPTSVWAVGESSLMFALVSIPVAQDFDDPSAEDRWRAGIGYVYLLDHEH